MGWLDDRKFFSLYEIFHQITSHHADGPALYPFRSSDLYEIL